jgi:2-dehydro-3-deoxyphosphogluconate aldolase/(4S)-4-hydroxy-2-oxoglutarate aldolase
MNELTQTLGRLGLVPVIKLEDPESAVQLGKALMEGNLPVAEVTFRTASAAQSIKRLRKELPTLLVGAGTVLTLAQAEAAVEAGASFAVTPGFNPRIVEYFISKGIPVIPGVNSPTQVEMGLERGLQLLKFFPAEASGGTRMLKALYGPYAEVKFVPTGGIDAGNLADYLGLPNVVACGGSWMVKEDYIKQGRFADIAAACRTAVELVASCRKKQ